MYNQSKRRSADITSCCDRLIASSKRYMPVTNSNEQQRLMTWALALRVSVDLSDGVCSSHYAQEIESAYVVNGSIY